MEVSRRNFLAGSAAAAAAPPLASKTVRETAERRAGPDKVAVRLRVNGADREIEIEPRATLLEVLRWQLGLTGPKEVCDRGACSACTVLVDDKPSLACMTLAIETEGKAIVTVEGIGTPESPNDVQQAFIDHDAVQCGYCIPGFVMSIEGARRRNPSASYDELKESLAGNLCRCGSYTKIFEAAARIAGLNPPAGEPERNAPASIENELGRVDGPAKITGAAVYSADAQQTGMLFAQHVPCPYASATLTKADVDTVRRLPGVVEVDIAVGDSFEYSGAPIGYVCAESPAALRDAITALNLTWEHEYVETDPYKLHEQEEGPFPPDMSGAKSNDQVKAASAALEDAAVVVEQTYRTQVQNHCTLEPHGGMVDPTTSPAIGWMSTQGTFTCTSAVARGLEKKQDEIAVKCDYVGGGFGSKFGAGREGLLAAQLAGKFDRPVRVFNNREYEHLDTGNRPGSLQWMKIGADRDGKIRGGYVYTAGLVGFESGGGGVNNPGSSWYDFGDVANRHREIHQPHGIPRPFRAPGRPQGLFAVEAMIDELAAQLGIDPIEIRLRNEKSETRKQMLAKGAKEIGWDQRMPSGSQTGRVRRGYGVAAGDWGNRGGRCEIGMTAKPDGSVHVFSGTQDIGTGQRTLIADYAADSLGLPRSMVTVHLADSRLPFGPASGGSVTARFTTPAVMDAAVKLLTAVGLDGEKASSLDAWKSACSELDGDTEVKGSFNQDYWGKGSSDAVQFATVAVDADTGVVQVEKIVALQACGVAVNRLTAENQINGGVIMGLSWAMFEDKIVDPQLGYQLNSDLLMYKLAGSKDIPEIVPLMWPQEGAIGARSLGEPTTIPTAAAIANAVANAIGAPVTELPITPQRVLALLEEKA